MQEQDRGPQPGAGQMSSMQPDAMHHGTLLCLTCGVRAVITLLPGPLRPAAGWRARAQLGGGQGHGLRDQVRCAWLR